MATASTSKFRGVLLGSLIGDCFGEMYEGRGVIPLPDIVKRLTYFVEKYDPNATRIMLYTDDTQMTMGVCSSLIECRTPDYEHMGKRFAEDFFANEQRGYGPSIGNVFKAMRTNEYKDIFKPATLQIDGKGSWGNGGAMRVSPLPLFSVEKDTKYLTNMVHEVTRLTHSNALGLLGSQFQALAIRLVLEMTRDDNQLDVPALLSGIQNGLMEMDYPKKDVKVYLEALDKIRALLKKGEFDWADAINKLGNDIKAHESVPTALYCFICAQIYVKDLPFDTVMLRSLVLAVCLGGDTDTIASMACALAGAQEGDSIIPEGLLKACEAHGQVRDNADALLKII